MYFVYYFFVSFIAKLGCLCGYAKPSVYVLYLFGLFGSVMINDFIVSMYCNDNDHMRTCEVLTYDWTIDHIFNEEFVNARMLVLIILLYFVLILDVCGNTLKIFIFVWFNSIMIILF